MRFTPESTLDIDRNNLAVLHADCCSFIMSDQYAEGAVRVEDVKIAAGHAGVLLASQFRELKRINYLLRQPDVYFRICVLLKVPEDYAFTECSSTKVTEVLLEPDEAEMEVWSGDVEYSRLKLTRENNEEAADGENTKVLLRYKMPGGETSSRRPDRAYATKLWAWDAEALEKGDGEKTVVLEGCTRELIGERLEQSKTEFSELNLVVFTQLVL